MDSKERFAGSRMTPRTLTGLILLIPLALVFFLAWQSVESAATIPEASPFLRPFLLFSLGIILFGFETLLLEPRLLLGVTLLLVFGPSLLIVGTPLHAVFVGAGALLSWRAISSVKRELGARVRLSVSRALTTGLPVFLLGLSLALSSQYYVHLRSLSWEELIPNFHLSDRNTNYLLRAAGLVYTPLREADARNMTIDEFFLTTLPNTSLPGTEFPLESASALQPSELSQIEQVWRDAQLEARRASLSALVGREVEGGEKVSTVFSLILEKKLAQAALSGNPGSSSAPPLIPFFLALLLFLTVYPFATLLLSFYALVATLLFRLAHRLGLVKIEVRTIEQEYLAL